MDALLGNFSLADLAARKSYKWRCYPPDVLPAFVAEMDFMVAEPIAAAVRAALEVGDTGYPDPGDLGEAFGGLRARRLRPDDQARVVLPHPRRDDRDRRDPAGRTPRRLGRRHQPAGLRAVLPAPWLHEPGGR